MLDFHSAFFLTGQQSFRCYVGEDENYKEQVCNECINGIGCLCAKVPNFNGLTKRFCRVNPHNALGEGCEQADYHQGFTVNHCYCKTSLCNSANGHSSKSTLMIFIILMIVAKYTTIIKNLELG